MTRTRKATEKVAGVMLALLALASAPTGPEDWERRGNQAYYAGRYEEAAQCYQNAADRSHEPGRVAHNQAVALFNIGKYRDAERFFRCELESSSDSKRRARALYDLGTCLLHASEGHDANLLAESIDYLNRCARLKDVGGDLLPKTKYNLELAKQLWRKIRSDSPPPPERDPGASDENPRPEAADQTNGTEQGTQPGTSNGLSNPKAVQRPGGNESQETNPSMDRPPGAGSMSPIPDEEQLKPLPPAEARELLRQAAERIARERRALQRSNAGSGPRPYPDW